MDLASRAALAASTASVAVTGTECVALDRETSLGNCSEEACASWVFENCVEVALEWF